AVRRSARCAGATGQPSGWRVRRVAARAPPKSPARRHNAAWSSRRCGCRRMAAAGIGAPSSDPSAAACAALDAAGPVDRAHPGFRPRPAQQRLAAAVARTLDARDVLLAEAGTGTGKTYAYLVPALLSGLRTIIATGTRALQDQ